MRDLFAAAFFLAIGISVDLEALLPMLPGAFALAVVTGLTKVATGWYAASVDGVSRKGRMRAGTALIARGEFSIVIISLAATTGSDLQPFVTAYVLIVAVLGPVITRIASRSRPGCRVPRRPRPDPGPAAPRRPPLRFTDMTSTDTDRLAAPRRHLAAAPPHDAVALLRELDEPSGHRPRTCPAGTSAPSPPTSPTSSPSSPATPSPTSRCPRPPTSRG